MKKIAVVILSLLIGFGATAKIQKPKKKAKKQPIGNIISIEVMHTGCFGQCPTYSVEINSNGIATYNAIRFNEDTGTYTKNIGKTKAAAVLKQATKYRIDTCQDNYLNQIPDLPNINFVVVYKNKTKKIYSGKYGPEFLQIISKSVSDAGKKTEKSTGWKKITE